MLYNVKRTGFFKTLKNEFLQHQRSPNPWMYLLRDTTYFRSKPGPNCPEFPNRFCKFSRALIQVISPFESNPHIAAVSSSHSWPIICSQFSISFLTFSLTRASKQRLSSLLQHSFTPAMTWKSGSGLRFLWQIFPHRAFLKFPSRPANSAQQSPSKNVLIQDV